MQFIAKGAFGLEGLIKQDLTRLGALRVTPLPTGGVLFEGDLALALRANLWLRTADRVLLQMGRFPARTFDELFEGIRALNWEDVLPDDAQLPVKAHCARSQLMSPSDCQSIAKKAVARRMQERRGLNWLGESGAPHEIDIGILKDEVTVGLNMSGAALSRRGYRTLNGEAPLRETLAAAVALWSPWRPNTLLHDPCCGTGTLLIEAAFIALDRAPGLMRSVDCEAWPAMDAHAVQTARGEAAERFAEGAKRPLRLSGSDIDAQALELARRHLVQAGLAGRVSLEKKDVRDLRLPPGGGAVLTNPPYGERLGDRRAAQAVARQLGELMRRSSGWSMAALTADTGFEKAFGRRADKRRRLYNGRIECELMTYNGRGGERP
ncbi:MAG: class I SAM-dependent RNA methyltransferase [Eubacteriales bacterium]|nr:class I SAM-dependent RNA methyltransferase [Eubacteriales bacterium]